jgi:hypothetical protein
MIRADFRKSCCFDDQRQCLHDTSQLPALHRWTHITVAEGHKRISSSAYSLGAAAFLALGVAFFLVAVLGFLGAAAFLGLVAFLVAVFLVAVFLGAW